MQGPYGMQRCRKHLLRFSKHIYKHAAITRDNPRQLVELPLQVREDPFLSLRHALPTAKDHFVILEHSFNGDFCWLKLRGGEIFGCLGGRTSQSLKRLASFSCVQFDCIASILSLEHARTQWRKAGKSSQLLVDFNIYGHEHSASKVGDALAIAKLFLQVPTYDTRSTTYDNPQDLKLPDVAHMSLGNSLEPPPQSAIRDGQEASSSEIETLLDHIPQSTFLRVAFTNDRISTPLIKYVLLSGSHAVLTLVDTKAKLLISFSDARQESYLLRSVYGGYTHLRVALYGEYQFIKGSTITKCAFHGPASSTPSLGRRAVRWKMQPAVFWLMIWALERHCLC